MATDHRSLWTRLTAVVHNNNSPSFQDLLRRKVEDSGLSQSIKWNCIVGIIHHACRPHFADLGQIGAPFSTIFVRERDV